MSLTNWKGYAALMLAAGVLAVGGILLFYHLGAEPFQDYDEATYAAVTKDMQTSGDMLSFTLFGQEYFRKPPLLFWLIDASEQVIPDIEAAARTPSAFAALLLIALAMIFVYEAGGSVFGVVTAGLVLATTGAFVEATRQVRFDSLVTFFDLLAVYAFFRGTRERKWYVLVGIALGLAVLAKGILVIYAGAALLAIAFSSREYKWLSDWYFWGGIVLGLLIAIPWHVYETLHYGVAFWNEYFGAQVVDRVRQSLFGENLTNVGYVQYLAAFAVPWAFVWCAGAVAAPYAYIRGNPRTRVALITTFIGALFVLLVLFITKTKALTYLVPFYPFIAIATGLVAAEFWRIKNVILRTVLVVALILLSFAGFWTSLINGTHTGSSYTALVVHAREEYAAAMAIRAEDPSAKLYEYGENDIGSLQFYTGIHPVYGYYADSLVTSPIFIILKPEDRAALSKVQPYRILTPIYTGTYVDVVSTGTD